MTHSLTPSEIVVNDNFKQMAGDQAQEQSILAARALADTLRATVGPKGLDKMLVAENGPVTITNDGVTILRKMQVEHPAAKLVTEVAKTQEDEVGDGTSTAIILAGQLLVNAQELLEQGTHRSLITRGFNNARDLLQSEIGEITRTIEPDDAALLRSVAETSMNGKHAEYHRETLSDLVVNSVIDIASEEESSTPTVDLASLAIKTNAGWDIQASRVIPGAVLETEPLSEEMPSELPEAEILLLDQPLTIDESPVTAEVDVDDPQQLKEFIEKAPDEEQVELAEKVQQIVDVGVNVVICHDEIHEVAQHHLKEAGILAIHDLSSEVYGDETSEITFLQNALGTRIVSDLDSLDSSSLIHGHVRHRSNDGLVYIEGSNVDGLTLLVGGTTEYVSAELCRALEDALDTVSQVVRHGDVLPGGGAAEVELAARLRDHANSIETREQLSIMAFADALETIPQTLATNAGLDSLDTLMELRTAHSNGDVYAGLNVFTGDIINTLDAGIIEPRQVKTQAIVTAVDITNMILNIDEIIGASDSQE